jgi:hypothetical protein
MSRYAKNTKVSVSKSKQEICNVLDKYGAVDNGIFNNQSGHTSVIYFAFNDLRFQIELPLPDPNLYEYKTHYEQDVRQKWRCLFLVIKAKLESVESGINTFEEAFMPHIVMPDGKTLGRTLLPNLNKAIEAGEMPKGLPFLGGDTQ